MSSLFRSQEMALCQLFLQSEAAYACVSELGELGLVQFRDLNPNVSAFQRKFVAEVRRCEEMERKLRYVEREMKKDGIRVTETGDSPKAPFPREMVDLEAAFEKLESELREVNTNAEALKRNYLELSELREVLKKTQTFFSVHEEEHIYQSLVEDSQYSLATAEAPTAQTSVMQLGFVAGVINRERMMAFERILWFACRGNVFLKTEEIAQPLEDPHSGNEMHKCVFLIFFQGEQLKARVRKICDGYKATLYPCPESAQERQEMLNGVTVRLEDLRHVLEQTKEHRSRVLKKAAKEIHHWILKARKIKAIYHTLNMANFDMSHNSLIAECWCPVSALDQIKMGLNQGTEASGSTVPPILHRMETDEDPPTFQATNTFTQGFQNIVDAYGIANYMEVNPALYAVITFPFLFAVMFGDAGHGFIMFLFGLWMVVKEKSLLKQKTDNEIWNTFFGGRYIIMLMGLFSIYTGMCYNDIFSKSVNIFGTKWHPNYTLSTYESVDILQMNPEFDTKPKDPYPFGIDPVWQLSTNKITFLNSFKMKVAVILGICQMLFGVALSLANHIHYRRFLNIFCEFIPEVIFLLAIFGYLVATIFYKWLSYDVTLTQEAPSLLIHLINMFLMKYDTEDPTPLSQRPYYEGQKTAQTVMVALAGICIPWLLLPKPFILRAMNSRKQRAGGLSQSRGRPGEERGPT
ncbi:V-type proton ATPase 116 kDa subunit a 1-like [Liolophura sinensis]|uniref:V-type proton ATPase 116 kDa subunit a 1-like n=1 Tax=Liolophura sinensis TaxID=3198878 RepID=UPI0031582FAE